jgi:hypothetical protein
MRQSRNPPHEVGLGGLRHIIDVTSVINPVEHGTPPTAADRGSGSDRAFEIQSDWDVARMLAMAAFPPNRAEIVRWFAEHSQEWFA